MRLVLCGKNDSAVDALEHALARGDEVWVVGVRDDAGEDGWQRSLVGAARRAGLRLDQPPRINDQDFVRALREWRPDLLVSIQYDQILRDPLFRSIGCACLNLHFALLPRNRGVAPIAWAIREGDAESGVSLHHMIEDIDAGDLVAQRAVPIGPATTARELYDLLSLEAAALFRECHPFPPELVARRLPQDAARASYHRNGELDFADRRIVWDRPARELSRWMRSLVFPPYQFPELCARAVTLAVAGVGPAIEPSRGAPPGTVLSASAEGLRVAAADGALLLTELRADGERVDPRDAFRQGARLDGARE